MKPLRRLHALGAFADRRFGWGLAAGVAAAAVYTSAQVAIPLVTGSLVDEGLLAEDRQALFRHVLMLVGAAALSTLGRGVYRASFTWLAEKGRAQLQGRLLARLYGLPLASFDRERTGRLHSLLIEDAASAARKTGQVGSEATVAAFQLALLLSVLAAEYGRAILAAAVLIPLYTILPLIFARPIRRASGRALAATAEVNAALHESVQAVREIKVLGREDWSLERLRRLLSDEVGRRLRVVVLNSVFGIQYAVYFLVAGLVYWFGGLEVLAGNLSVGELVALVSLLAYLEGPVSRLSRLAGDFQQISAAVERIDDTLEKGAGPGLPEGSAELPPGRHRINVDGLSFRYDGANRPALEDVSFTIEPGERVALVGPSGVGKSTLVHLLARLYEPQAGVIRIAGRPAGDYRLDSLRREIGFVLQDALLFSGSVRDNLRLGRLDATDEEVERCARLANADGFIRRLPQGYETEVGERAVKLSGGQRQRIGIARVLLRDPGILILDEAMSSLDTESERVVQEALERLMAGRTTLSIAHRPSAFVRADRILVLDQGKLIDDGSHQELLVRCQLYRRLVGEGAEAPGLPLRSSA